VDLRGFEPRTFCLPDRCATNCATSPKSGARESNAVSPTSNAGRFPSPSPQLCPGPPRAGACLAVHCGVLKVRFSGHAGDTHGRQELNPQRAALETVALPVELRPQEAVVCMGRRKSRPVPVRVGGCVDDTRGVSRATAPGGCRCRQGGLHTLGRAGPPRRARTLAAVSRSTTTTLDCSCSGDWT
jgi:hypothetical protein